MNATVSTAWLRAAEDLDIAVIAPYTFSTRAGELLSVDVFLPHFGGGMGTILIADLAPSDVAERASSVGYFVSQLNPDSYSEYDRALFSETLDDFGWHGPIAGAPKWYTGKYWG